MIKRTCTEQTYFTATSDQNIKAASFYATASDTSYELYIVNDFKDEYSFAGRKKVAEGTLENARILYNKV